MKELLSISLLRKASKHFLLAVLALPTAVHAEDQRFIPCKEDGTTIEYTQCEFDRLSEEDWELKKEFNNDELWKKWKDARDGVCEHYSMKQFKYGTIRPLMQYACERRLNSEMKRFCLSGEDKQCG